MKSYQRQFREEIERNPIDQVIKDPEFYTDTLIAELIDIFTAAKFNWWRLIWKIGQIVAKIVLISISRRGLSSIKDDYPF